MSTATKEKPPSKSRPHIQMLPIAKLVPTPDNQRRPITKASLESMAKSLARDGFLHPIIVRKHPAHPRRWEIRAGERRWRAAQLAGFTHVPAIVRDLDDQAALSVTIAENLQRQNLHPLEEAAEIQQALDREYDLKAVAARLGKSIKHLARRASLTRLVNVWRDEILRPESDGSRLSVAHLELIARLPPETQTALADNDFALVFGRGFPTVEELRRIVDAGLHSLNAMPWPVDDESLDPTAGSCLNCPKRSGAQPLLFDGQEPPLPPPGQGNGKVSKSDRCLDPGCFDRKLAAHLGRCESRLRAEHPSLQLVQVTFDRPSPACQAGFGDRITRVYHPLMVKASHKSATPAMALDGPKAGRLVYLNLAGEESSGTVNGQRKRKGGKPDRGPLTMDERRDRLQRRRDAFVVKRVEAMLKALTPADVSATVTALKTRSDRDAKTLDIAALTSAFGTTARADRLDDGAAWTEYEKIREIKQADRTAASLLDLAEIWRRRLSGTDGSTASTQAADAKRMCAILGIDYAAIETEAATAIPQPKGWPPLPPPEATTELPGAAKGNGRAAHPKARLARKARRSHRKR
jgi:ParB/RepB/Spo0J family partition protein